MANDARGDRIEVDASLAALSRTVFDQFNDPEA
jgi:hypothetical protein